MSDTSDKDIVSPDTPKLLQPESVPGNIHDYLTAFPGRVPREKLSRDIVLHLNKPLKMENGSVQNSRIQQQTSLGGKARASLRLPSAHTNGGFVGDGGSSGTGSRRSSMAQAGLGKNKATRRLTTFTSRQVKQTLSEQQKSALAKYSSLSYSPTHSELYQNWLREHSVKSQGPCTNGDRWFLLSVIAVAIGIIAWLLRQCIQALSKVRWDRTKQYIEDGDFGRAYGWNAGMGAVYVLISALFVCFLHPPAAGGGTPEVISFLNGIVVHGSLSLKNLVVKFIANVFAVSSGLPAAIQGPVINYGAIIGAGVGQWKSKSLGWTPSAFKRFRNAEDRRAFTTAGVAAGVAAAFNAPIGGLLFAMEDLSSFWSKNLSWQTFYCGVLASGITSMLNNGFTGFQFQGLFGPLALRASEPIQIHIAAVVPAIAIGLIGGLMGAFFTQLNRGFVMARKIMLGSIKSPLGQKIFRMAETVLLVAIMHSYTTFLPKGFQCEQIRIDSNTTSEIQKCISFSENITGPINYQRYKCPLIENTTDSVINYNPIATLSMLGGQGYLDTLWSRDTLYAFNYDHLLAIMAIWVVMTAWTAGSAIAGGIFVPTLVTGALFGRAIGVGMLAIWTRVAGSSYPVNEWEWIDPGIMAVIGSAAMLSGVTRLAIAVTVILVEMSHDIDLTIPVLVAVLVAKSIADFLSKPLFKLQLEGKSLPFLDQDPQVVVDGSIANLELYKVRDVMKSPVCTIHSTETVAALARLLVDTDHGAFPVVRYDEETRTELALGRITRSELYVILCRKEVYDEDRVGSVLCPDIPYAEISVDYIADPTASLERVKTFTKFPIYHSIFVNLDPYISLSAPKVDEQYSLYRTYLLFRTLGLRHLVVTDIRNRVIGMVTRKDLMEFNISERLQALHDEESAAEFADDNTQSDSGCDILPAVTIATVAQKLKTHLEEEEEHEQINNNNSSRGSLTPIKSSLSSDSPRRLDESAVVVVQEGEEAPSIVQQLSAKTLSASESRRNLLKLNSQPTLDTPM